jgi:hypothetical protein
MSNWQVPSRENVDFRHHRPFRFACRTVMTSLFGLWLSLCAAAGTTASASASTSSQLPAPGHLIVGASITLPPTLYEANDPGSPALITPTQAQAVESTMWQLWETALVQSDTRALSELITPGPTLEGTINNCGLGSGGCVQETTPRAASAISVIVPLEGSYPIDFLAEVRTTQYVQGDNGLNVWEPWVEVQILTKMTATSPWQLSFDTGYDGVNAAAPPLLQFDLKPMLLSNDESGQYNPKPEARSPVPASKFLPLLAKYWQGYKNTGHQPSSPFFVVNGYAAAQGQQLAMERQGALYAGHREYFSFSADPAAGTWEFSSSGGDPFVCGSVLDTATDAARQGYLNQNADESNYGVPLPPGEYKKITSLVEHQVCVYGAGSLDEVGNDNYTSEVIGQGRSGAAGHVQQDTIRNDLETAYGVLAYQLLQYTADCKDPDSCYKSNAGKIASEFAQFSNLLTDHRYPSSATSDVKSLEQITNVLTNLFFHMSKVPGAATSLATIQRDAITLNEQFDAVIADLTPRIA